MTDELQRIAVALERIAAALENKQAPPPIFENEEPTPLSPTFILRDKSQNKQAPMFPIKYDGKKYIVDWDGKTTIPNGTVVHVHNPDYSPAELVIRYGELERYLPGYSGPSLINELPPTVGWILDGIPTYGVNTGKLIKGLVLNDEDTWLEQNK